MIELQMFAAASRESVGIAQMLFMLMGGPVLLLLLIELLCGAAIDRAGLVHRKEDPKQYWLLIVFHLVILLFVVGIVLAYLNY